MREYLHIIWTINRRIYPMTNTDMYRASNLLNMSEISSTFSLE